MDNWQPIETAPKDKTWILLTGGKVDMSWDGNDDDEPPVVVGQGFFGVEGKLYWQFAWYDSGYYGEYESPTHWQPLPKPPGAA